MLTIELRCPTGPQRLFSKLRIGENAHITNENLIEFACADCRKYYKTQGHVYERVLHRYNLAGVLVETDVI